MIRIATNDDVEWLADIAEECYPVKIDKEASLAWLRNNIGKNNRVIALKGEHSAVLAFVCTFFWRPGYVSLETQMFCGRRTRQGTLESLQLLKFLDDIRKELGYNALIINTSITDLLPFAKRLGAKLLGQSYILGD